MRLVVVSDTHGKHEELGILEGDVLIHCGDACNGFQRDPEDVDRLDSWFGRQQFDVILCTGGNHDFAFEERRSMGQEVLQNGIFLEDSRFEMGGVKFYGSPWTPELEGWAFYLEPELAETRWSQIPADTDVLITHTPPAGVLDSNSSGRQCGCPHLRDRITEIRPSIHCFGHVHASAGTHSVDGIQYMNAAMVSSRYKIVHAPLVYEL